MDVHHDDPAWGDGVLMPAMRGGDFLFGPDVHIDDALDEDRPSVLAQIEAQAEEEALLSADDEADE